MKIKALVAALMVVGLAAPTMAVNAKTKHKMTHSKSMSSKKSPGMGNGGGDSSNQGNVGPGTSNNTK